MFRKNIMTATDARVTTNKTTQKKRTTELKDVMKHIKKAAAAGYNGIRYPETLTTAAQDFLKTYGYKVTHIKSKKYYEIVW